MALAIKTFNECNRVELNTLAHRLGINRVTLYRWLGDRNAILTEVIWALGDNNLQHAYRTAGGQGGARVATAMSTFARQTLKHVGMVHFLTQESDLALRLLTTSQHPFQHRLTIAVEALLRQEHRAGALDLPTGLSLHDLAYISIRVGESFVYADSITGEVPDPERADRALHFLLR